MSHSQKHQDLEFLTLPFGLITYRTRGYFYTTSGGFLIKALDASLQFLFIDCFLRYMQHFGWCNKPHTTCTLTCVFPKSSLLRYEKISAPFLTHTHSSPHDFPPPKSPNLVAHWHPCLAQDHVRLPITRRAWSLESSTIQVT